jgi:Icc protein
MALYAWATDIHLDFLRGDEQRLTAFAESLIAQDPAGIFLTGDLSIAAQLEHHLSVIERVVQRPIYFVLGNHDYYGGSIASVRQAMNALSRGSTFLRYMPTTAYHALTPSTAVVGHDGWYDARFGKAEGSSFQLRDWFVIEDFLQCRYDRAQIVETARRLAHDGALHVQDGIEKAVREHEHVVVLTHVPPFEESHWHEGRPGDDNASPWFTSKVMGDVLLDAARRHPQHTFTVLAGHTHGRYSGRLRPNLHVEVGGAEYFQPRLQRLVALP